MGSRLPDRIVVVGTTGAGKTTLGRRLAALINAPFVELDALYWRPGWTSSSADELRPRVADALAGDRWVVDGNYSMVRDLIWPRAGMIVWLDYSLAVIVPRLFWRTLRRAVTREELWNGNRERLWDNFASRESLFLFALRTHKRRRYEFERLMSSTELAHAQFVRLRTPSEAAAWSAALTGVREGG